MERVETGPFFSLRLFGAGARGTRQPSMVGAGRGFRYGDRLVFFVWLFGVGLWGRLGLADMDPR